MKTRNTFTGLTAGVLLLSLTFLTAGCGGRDKTPSPSQAEPTISTESYEDTSTEFAPTKTIIDLGEKIIAKEFTEDLGKEAAAAAEYSIVPVNENCYNCQNQTGDSIFTCERYDNTVQYSMTEANDILTIFGILPGTDIDDASVTLEKHAFECTVDAAFGDEYYRYYYIYATDTILYEVGLHYNPETMEITTTEISLLDNTE